MAIQVPKILYFITRPDIGGAQAHVQHLISGFRERYQVALAIGWSGPLSERVGALGVDIHEVSGMTRSINPLSDVQAVRGAVSLIRRIQPDIIHAHSSKAGIIARIAGAICRVPTVFTAHGWAFSPGTPPLRRRIALLSERLVAPLSTRLICVAENDRQLALKSGVGRPDQLVTIRYGIEDCVVPEAQPELSPLRLIMVARFSEQKDQPTLLRALAQLKNQGVPLDGVHLDLVGSGPDMAQSQALAQELGIGEQVSFLGDRQDVPDLLGRSQIFVLSTHYEGLPISILEGMRAGLPIVASAVNGVPEEIDGGKTGLLVPPTDVAALAQALQNLIQSPDLRQQMGRASQVKFRQEFTMERMLKETSDVYEHILQGRQNRQK